MSVLSKSMTAFIGACVLFSTHVVFANSLFGHQSLFNTDLFGNSLSGGQWISANKIGAEARGYSYAICHYQTSSYSSFPNHRFSITIQGSQYSCPYSVQFNPVTNAWKQ
ncbi:hypothetical protein [Moraxella sp.]|uniref:hypothetical protein n=1 Tax=Moraxella sp. TaxID=479 RepID=UPI0026DC80FE|nr:hypothetical protein [Moraxella sp.]MDO4894638.1 hypothetical protein [Moraxella sp.]